jgi:hypothetical protein
VEEEEEGSTYSRVLLLFRLDARKPRQKKCRFSEASHSCRLVDLNTKLPRRLARCQIACLEEKHARTHAHRGANEDATERQEKKQESGKEKKKNQNTKKASKKIAMMRKKDMEIQERLDVQDVKSRKQDVAGDAKERKKRKWLERKNATQKRRAERQKEED